MRHFFTKAIVCAGVMASALALNGMAVFANTLDMTSVSTGTHGIFTVGSAVGTGSSQKTFTVDGNSITQSNYYKFGNSIKGSADNAISFTVSGPSTVTVAAISGSNGNDSQVGLYDSAFKTYGNTVDIGQTDITVGTITINEAGTYYLCRSIGKTANLYYLDVTEQSSDPTLTGLATSADLNLTGGTLQLSANMNSVATNANYSIVWSSSNNSIATVNSSGLVTKGNSAKNNDTVIITAKLVDSNGNDVIINDKVVKQECEVTCVDTFTVTGTYTPTNASLSSSTGNLTASNGEFSLVLNSGETAKITATLKEYYTYVSDEINANTQNLAITMTKLEGNAGNKATRLDLSNFNIPSSNLPESGEIVDSNSKQITAGDFVFSTSGKIKLYINNGSITLVPQSGASVKYTPSADGVININAARNGGDAGKRGFTIKGGDLDETFVDNAASNGTLQLNSYDVTANQEYTITFNGGAVLLDYIEFVDNNTDVKISDSLTEISGLIADSGLDVTAKYAKVNDDHYFVLDFVENSTLKSMDKLQYFIPTNGTVKMYTPNFTIDTLFSKVVFDEAGEDYIEEAGHCYYAFKFTDADNTYTTLDAKIGAASGGSAR
ncbi:MAG TPA: hypothetical protein DCG28_02150 [Lachnospiraceae bacterium]|nr:hypothetical protein [Lachnospiraceae bacterium]